MSKSGWIKTLGPFVVLIVAVLLAIILISSRKPPEEKVVESKDFLVEAREIGRESTAFVVTSQGNVVPKNQTRISAQVSGQVVSLASVFEAGGMVKKGDTLVTLEQDDYQTELKLAEAELAQAQAALQEEVARGKVAETEWRSVNSVVPPELGLRKPQLASQQASVKAAEANLERAKRNLARTEIKAPYNGIVIARAIDTGQFISAGGEIGTLYSTDIAEIRIPITESELAYVDLRREMQNSSVVKLKAKVAGKIQHWEGKLVRSEGILDTGSRVIYAVAQVDDPYNVTQQRQAEALRFGQFVEAEIVGSQSRSLYVLPRSAMRLDNTVLTVSADNTLKINEVEVVRATAEHVYIDGGLPERPKVVFSVVPNPYEGMKVRVSGEELKQEKASEKDAALSTEGAGNE